MCEHDIDRELTDSRPQQPVVVVRLSAAVVTLNQISSFRTIPLVLARTDSPLEYELLGRALRSHYISADAAALLSTTGSHIIRSKFVRAALSLCASFLFSLLTSHVFAPQHNNTRD